MGCYTMPDSSGPGDPRTLVTRWFEDLFSRGDLDVAREILAEDVRYHGPTSLTPQDVRGPEDVQEYVATYQNAFPDLQYAVEEVYDAGDALAVRWSVVGTQQEDLFGMTSAGETFSEDGINIFVVEDGRIAEVWSEWDTLKMGRDLEVVPPVGGE